MSTYRCFNFIYLFILWIEDYIIMGEKLHEFYNLGVSIILIYLWVILKQSLKKLKNFSVINLDSCCLIECLCLGAFVSLWFGFHENVKKKFKRKDYSIKWRVCNSQIMIHMKLNLSKISNYWPRWPQSWSCKGVSNICSVNYSLIIFSFSRKLQKLTVTKITNWKSVS